MRRVVLVLAIASFLFFAPLTFADKLAPPQNTLQPLPQNVQPAVSENVQRTASPQDIQTIQQAAPSEPTPSSNVPQNSSPIALNFSSPSSSSDLGIILGIIAALVVLGSIGVWFWKSF